MRSTLSHEPHTNTPRFLPIQHPCRPTHNNQIAACSLLMIPTALRAPVASPQEDRTAGWERPHASCANQAQEFRQRVLRTRQTYARGCLQTSLPTLKLTNPYRALKSKLSSFYRQPVGQRQPAMVDGRRWRFGGGGRPWEAAADRDEERGCCRQG